MNDKDKKTLGRIRHEVQERAESKDIGGARWMFDMHWLVRKLDEQLAEDVKVVSISKFHARMWFLLGLWTVGTSVLAGALLMGENAPGLFILVANVVLNYVMYILSQTTDLRRPKEYATD